MSLVITAAQVKVTCDSWSKVLFSELQSDAVHPRLNSSLLPQNLVYFTGFFFPFVYFVGSRLGVGAGDKIIRAFTLRPRNGDP